METKKDWKWAKISFGSENQKRKRNIASVLMAKLEQLIPKTFFYRLDRHRMCWMGRASLRLDYIILTIERFLTQKSSIENLWRTGNDWRTSLGVGRHAGAHLAHLLLLYLEGCQRHWQSGLLHGSLPLLPAGGAAHPRCHSRRRRRRHLLLPHSQSLKT